MKKRVMFFEHSFPPDYDFDYVWFVDRASGKRGRGHLWALSKAGNSGLRIGNEITLSHAKIIVLRVKQAASEFGKKS